jgi:hypothetical protein
MNDLPSLLSSHVSHRKTNRYIRLITKISDILANIRLRTKFGPRALAGLVFAEPQDGTVPDKRSPLPGAISKRSEPIAGQEIAANKESRAAI